MNKIKCLISWLLIFTIPCYSASFNIRANLPVLPTPNPTPITYYVAQNCSGNCSGSDQLNYISWANSNSLGILKPGDIGYVCGEIRYQSNSQGYGPQIFSTGIPGHRLDIRGDCPGNPGSINNSTILNSGAWTSVGSTVYTTPFTGVVLRPTQSGIVVEDDVALVALPWKGSAAATISYMSTFTNVIANSTTSNTIGTGTFTFTTFPGLSIPTGVNVFMGVSTNNPNGMGGTVTSYNSSTGVLVINATASSGSGTFTTWYVEIAGGAYSYDATNQVLYVMTYETDSPSGHIMEASFQNLGTFGLRLAGEYTTLEHLTIKNMGDYGIVWEGNVNGNYSPRDNIISNNVIENISNWGAILVDQTNFQFHDNSEIRTVWGIHNPSGQAFGEGVRYYQCIGGAIYNNDFSHVPGLNIDLWHSIGGGIRVYNNTMHDSNGEYSAGGAGIYLDNSVGNYIYNNLIYTEPNGIVINAESGAPPSGYNTIYNNLIYNFQGNGMSLGLYGFPSPITSEYNSIFNNTIVNVRPTNSIYFYTTGFAVQISRSWNDTFQNNIVYPSIGILNNTPGVNANFPSGYFNYNTYSVNPFSFNNPSGNNSFAGWQAYLGDFNSTNQNQSTFLTNTFVSPGGTVDLHLLSGSAPVNAGKNLFSIFTTDFDGVTRPATGAWDTGAYNNQ